MNIERIDGARGHQPVRGPEATPDRVKSAGNDRPGSAPKADGVDTVSLSDRAQELKAAMKAVQQAPDVREDRVAALRQQIADGSYGVPSDVLARDILRGGL